MEEILASVTTVPKGAKSRLFKNNRLLTMLTSQFQLSRVDLYDVDAMNRSVIMDRLR
jgi:hypothetical protein